jgi:Flp pilus assembly protein TadG
MRRIFDRFRRDQSGNVTLIFGLALIPVFGAVGAAVDYSNANKVRTALQAAADAATIGAVAKSSPAMLAAATMKKDGTIAAGVTDAKNIFTADMTGRTGFKLTDLKIDVAKTKMTVTSSVQFSAEVPTYFMGLINQKTITVKGTAKAANGKPAYIDFYLLLDNSPSMGVAATPADISKMVSNTPDQCAFACHDKSNSNNYYKLAKKLGVTTRIDVLRSATQQLMDTAADTETVDDQYRVAIYTFNRELEEISSLNSNLSSVKGKAQNIDLVELPYASWNDYQLTDYDRVLPDINKLIGNPGSGSSSSGPQKVLFFVSDGVADFNKAGKRTIAPIDIASCTAIKKRGIKIAMLYTTYLPLPTNDFYNKNVAPFAANIAPTMQSCASPDLYFEVSPTEGISAAMTALFHKLVAQAHLTR